NVFLLGLVFLFFVNGTAWSVVLGVAVALLTYFIEVFIDNNYARMKWEVTLKVGWFTAITVGFVNLLVLNFM
ncbi:MAG TPA: NADH-quinone oxidoreductase subunit H, partial [Bacillota bacterium]|nr:NADH-quinone oxidoreductase subunit H [Bacillota bacterium]